MQYLVIFDIKYNTFIQNKEILNRNHDYAMLRSEYSLYVGINNEENPFIMGGCLN